MQISTEGFYHPNIYPSGTVCLSILNEEEGWSPSITLKQILLGMTGFVERSESKSPAQSPAHVMYTQDRTEYNRLVKEQSKSIRRRFERFEVSNVSDFF